VISGKGVVVREAVDLVLDEMGPEALQERPTVDLDTLSTATRNDFRGAVEEATRSVSISRASFRLLPIPIRLTRPFPFDSVPRDRRDSRHTRGQWGNVLDDHCRAYELDSSSTPGSGVIPSSEVSFKESDPVDADAADLGGATGVPAASAEHSRKESTRDAE